jgi:hypothetical protein
MLVRTNTAESIIVLSNILENRILKGVLLLRMLYSAATFKSLGFLIKVRHVLRGSKRFSLRKMLDNCLDNMLIIISSLINILNLPKRIGNLESNSHYLGRS